jgi:hypothetical protein
MVITGNRAGWLAWWIAWLIVWTKVIMDGATSWVVVEGALALAVLGIVVTPLIDRRNSQKTRMR